MPRIPVRVSRSEATSEAVLRAASRSIALFFDDTHTDVAGLHRASLAAQKLVSEGLAPGDRVAVFTDSGNVTLDFTADSAALLAALRKLMPHVNHNAGYPLCPRMTPFQAYVIERNLDLVTRQTAVNEAAACNSPPPVTAACIHAQEDLVRDLAKSIWDANKSESTVALDVVRIALRRLAIQPGSRMLILVSQGFISGEMDRQTTGLIDTAIRARIVINAIDPAGLDPYFSGLRQQVLSEFPSTASASTGSRYIHNNNDIMGGLRRLAETPETSYLLGFSPDAAPDGKFHPLKVRLNNQHGLRIESRAGYYASPTAGQELTAQQRIDRAIFSEEKGTRVPVSIGLHPSRTKGGLSGLTVIFNVDANGLKFKKQSRRFAQQLTFTAALEDADGAYRAGKQATMDLFLTPATLARFRSKGLRTTLSFAAPPGNVSHPGCGARCGGEPYRLGDHPVCIALVHKLPPRSARPIRKQNPRGQNIIRLMHAPIDEQVIDFYGRLFESMLSDQFRENIRDTRKRRDVIRRVEEASDAASQSLTRLFASEKVSPKQAQVHLAGLETMCKTLVLDDVANANVSPDTVASKLLASSPIPGAVTDAKEESLYRVALHTIVQVLLLVGPVMSEWRRLNFSSTFELPRRVINRLNQISDKLAGASFETADRRYEEQYRDHLLSRFNQVSVATVRMSTQMDVDIRELFVMPRAGLRRAEITQSLALQHDLSDFLDLKKAREFFSQTEGENNEETNIRPLIDIVQEQHRVVLIGLPGSGKSTFLEWLQLQLAYVEIELLMAGEQAIPVLLRVRELDPQNLPDCADMLSKATASRDRAALAPAGWLKRHMERGRVFFMVDGFDEVEPELRDNNLLPWISAICEKFPKCRYLFSSRPVGYPHGTLSNLEFAECMLADFNKEQVGEYAKHWCTAVRLARNESEEESRHEGEKEGKFIVKSFEDNAYIRNLARNPLMLSAICLVNFFEHGKLPDDRVMLYGMCVEGLLHHWDVRRGIQSEFGLEEKLRACRELAIEMQSADRAEYEADKVLDIFTRALGNAHRAQRLLEHIRYRTGLVLERRQGVFAFAHLTFQEYLAAIAVSKGNLSNITIDNAIADIATGRWNEVIALYCGIVEQDAKRTIDKLLTLGESYELSQTLTEAYFCSPVRVREDSDLRFRLGCAIASGHTCGSLKRFPTNEAAEAANAAVGLADHATEAGFLLSEHPDMINEQTLIQRLELAETLSVSGNAEIFLLTYGRGSDDAVSAALRMWNPALAGTVLVALTLRSRISTPVEHRAMLAAISSASETQLSLLLDWSLALPIPDNQDYAKKIAKAGRKLLKKTQNVKDVSRWRDWLNRVTEIAQGPKTPATQETHGSRK